MSDLLREADARLARYAAEAEAAEAGLAASSAAFEKEFPRVDAPAAAPVDDPAPIAEVIDLAIAAAERDARAAVPTGNDEVAARVLELAAMAAADYERARIGAARELGVRVTALDGFVRAARMASGDEPARVTQRDALVALALQDSELWHDDADEAYATVRVDGHLEHYKVRSSAFRRWLTRSYGDENKIDGPAGPIAAAPGSQAMTEAIAAIEANAGRGPLCVPSLRLAGSAKSEIVLDLCDPAWRAVRVGSDGWDVVANPGYRFVRAPGMLALPKPVRGDGLAKLRRHLKLGVSNEVLVLGWLIGALSPRGPYAILAVHGEQGSGKSTLVRMLRRLVDPNKADDRSKPKDEEDLIIAAANSWVVCFDNLSRIDENMSDAMCRIATGAGFGTRTLYTNNEETIFRVRRPQIVNGIPDLAQAADLIDRCITISLPARDEAEIAFEEELWAQFYDDLPEMLGFLLDAASCALRRLDQVKLQTRPRLVDFARWVEAAAPALGWAEGEFLAAYLRNRAAGAVALVEDSPLARALKRLLDQTGGTFEGTPSALLAAVTAVATEAERYEPGWPKAANGLGTRVRRLAPALRAAGLAVTIPDRADSARAIRLARVDKKSSEPSEASTGPVVGVSDADSSSADGRRSRHAADEVVSAPPSNPAGPDSPDGHDGFWTTGTMPVPHEGATVWSDEL